MHFHDLREEVGIAHLPQPFLFFFHGETRQIVHFFGVETREVALRHIRERRLRNKLRPRQRVSPRNKTVFPKRFFVEEHARAELQGRKQLLVEGLIELLYINTQLRQQVLGDLAVLGWTLDRLCSSVAQQLASARLKLIALGVPAEVVMIIQNQNARLWTRALAVKVRRRQPADSGSHHHQIVGLTGINGLARLFPKSPVAQSVGRLERTCMTAAQPGQRRRIVIRRLLRIGLHFEGRKQMGRNDCRAHGERNSIKEITPRDPACHAQLSISQIVHNPLRQTRRLGRAVSLRRKRLNSHSFGAEELPASAFFTADSAPWNPMRLCVPSQNGLETEPPQRQREKAVLPVRSYLLPSASTSSMEPSGASTRYGPFFLTVIFTTDMKPPLGMRGAQDKKITASSF